MEKSWVAKQDADHTPETLLWEAKNQSKAKKDERQE
jgi:hypothetical protein